jgi:aspartokinase
MAGVTDELIKLAKEFRSQQATRRSAFNRERRSSINRDGGKRAGGTASPDRRGSRNLTDRNIEIANRKHQSKANSRAARGRSSLLWLAFRARDSGGETTTLGRGGSDLIDCARGGVECRRLQISPTSTAFSRAIHELLKTRKVDEVLMMNCRDGW